MYEGVSILLKHYYYFLILAFLGVYICFNYITSEHFHVIVSLKNAFETEDITFGIILAQHLKRRFRNFKVIFLQVRLLGIMSSLTRKFLNIFFMKFSKHKLHVRLYKLNIKCPSYCSKNFFGDYIVEISKLIQFCI